MIAVSNFCYNVFMPPQPLPISTYLENLNRALRAQPGRLIGEVSQLQFYPGRSYLFFSLKDSSKEGAGAMIKCIMWKTDYERSGVALSDGMEIIVSGFAEIYAPSGSLTFKAQAVELVGEGALKKAYDELKKKLEHEGVFADEKKRAIPSFVQKIGVITSRDGAVINDFLTNIGRHGFSISLIDSRVEGALATDELIRSVQSFRAKAEAGEIDVLVVIRGGGSMESLLPFNNEMLVREIAAFPVPVIAGIGHDKDITLAALAADLMVSTPTAVTAVLNDSWDRALSYVELWEKGMLSSFRDVLYAKQSLVADMMADIRQHFSGILERFGKIEFRLREELARIQYCFQGIVKDSLSTMVTIVQKLATSLRESVVTISSADKQLSANDPERLLKLGYSIARVNNKIIRSIKDAAIGDAFSIRLKDGIVEGEVEKIISA